MLRVFYKWGNMSKKTSKVKSCPESATFPSIEQTRHNISLAHRLERSVRPMIQCKLMIHIVYNEA